MYDFFVLIYLKKHPAKTISKPGKENNIHGAEGQSPSLDKPVSDFYGSLWEWRHTQISMF